MEEAGVSQVGTQSTDSPGQVPGRVEAPRENWGDQPQRGVLGLPADGSLAPPRDHWLPLVSNPGGGRSRVRCQTLSCLRVALGPALVGLHLSSGEGTPTAAAASQPPGNLPPVPQGRSMGGGPFQSPGLSGPWETSQPVPEVQKRWWHLGGCRGMAGTPGTGG